MTFERLSPVFPVRDIELAVGHYRKLGFAVRRYEGPDPYAFATRDGIELHLAQVTGLKPKKNMSAVYLYVDDADALYEEWSGAGTDGRLVEPTDTSYGLREGACLDRDANLIRFGSSISDRAT
ncbi:MAG: VOC family protein [Acidimicrobiia bacterium]|nr:VOC family protein [Acidimicrobiia bacterium]NNF10404.1 VOC family protein [Acidimicrobiia bacterium]NNL68601.1 VOC family protein [Acidimicrobiia bacterium]